jgi:crotonobetainyl-CoA:carnitine CoA-transferase CaiB-like acyl-CoA transferase
MKRDQEMTTNGTGAGPLAHIKVLDLTIARAGPTCVRVLADHGAHVTQVVRPEQSGLEGPGFDRENLHRNKRSIAINLQTDAGRDVFYRLAKDADVVVENFRADVKHRLKVDYETLKAINRRIVYGSNSGFGQDGPYRSRPGVDQIAQGLGGLMSITGPPGGGPWRVGIPISDLCAGLYLAHGIMAALIERERSGEGQWVQTSLLEAMIAMLDFQATRWLIGGEVPPQAGNDHPTAFPMGVFPAKDGMVNIAAAGDRMFLDFLRVIGAEDLAQDERFRTRQARASHRPELRALVEERTRTWPCEALIEALNAVGVPCGPILTIDQVFENPQVQHLALAQTVESERYGTLKIIRSPVRLSRTSTSLRRAAPAPGADTDVVLKEYGYSPEEISALKASRVVGTDPLAVDNGKRRSK